MKEGDKVYILATVTNMPDENQRMIRCITAQEGVVVWCSKEELKEAE